MYARTSGSAWSIKVASLGSLGRIWSATERHCWLAASGVSGCGAQRILWLAARAGGLARVAPLGNDTWSVRYHYATGSKACDGRAYIVRIRALNGC